MILVQLPGGFDPIDVDGEGNDAGEERIHVARLVRGDGPRLGQSGFEVGDEVGDHAALRSQVCFQPRRPVQVHGNVVPGRHHPPLPIPARRDVAMRPVEYHRGGTFIEAAPVVVRLGHVRTQQADPSPVTLQQHRQMADRRSRSAAADQHRESLLLHEVEVDAYIALTKCLRGVHYRESSTDVAPAHFEPDCCSRARITAAANGRASPRAMRGAENTPPPIRSPGCRGSN